MERFNAMGKEFCINDEVMCRDDDGTFVQYEEAQAEIGRLNVLIDKFEEVVKEMRTQSLPDWLWMKSYALLGEAQKGHDDHISMAKRMIEDMPSYAKEAWEQMYGKAQKGREE